MWVFTKDGFYSACKDRFCTVDELSIRARRREDLERLKEELKNANEFFDQEILSFKHSDYPYRMMVNRFLWAEYLYNTSSQIDYSTVKDNIIPYESKVINRKPIYYTVWRTLLALEDKRKKVI